MDLDSSLPPSGFLCIIPSFLILDSDIPTQLISRASLQPHTEIHIHVTHCHSSEQSIEGFGC